MLGLYRFGYCVFYCLGFDWWFSWDLVGFSIWVFLLVWHGFVFFLCFVFWNNLNCCSCFVLDCGCI